MQLLVGATNVPGLSANIFRSRCGPYATTKAIVKKISHTFLVKDQIKNLNTHRCWSTLRPTNPSGRELFGVAFENTALSPHDQWLKETQRQRSEEQESESPLFTSWRNRDARP